MSTKEITFPVENAQEGSFIKALGSIIKDNEAIFFLLNTMKSYINDFTNGMIAPEKCYFDDKGKTFHINFKIRTDKEYKVKLKVKHEKNDIAYGLSVTTDTAQYGVRFAKKIFQVEEN